ncbi:hypothetical protein [Rubripirellula reticaptiva]|uniref:LemA family protein n=1 Tax=Rubripirellula reticaptiva TaxID=2528013 RepID=A0A5C6FEZ0_9BACT|nr:hypothetical protein [Rubripirellula reticaptiva]TWU58151.1 hypothetical protein Poly59_10600 [Rubripirellula reticaptiva]
MSVFSAVARVLLSQLGHFVIWIVVASFATASMAAAYAIRQEKRAFESFRHQAFVEWRHLRQRLLDRHLVVVSLLDSLPDHPLLNYNKRELQGCNRVAEASVRNFQIEVANSNECATMCRTQDEFIDALFHMTKAIEQNSLFPSQKGIAACLSGLESLQKKIDESKATYNASVIVYRTRLESRKSLWRLWMAGMPPELQELSFGWTGSDIETPSVA